MHAILKDKLSELIDICTRHNVRSLALFGSAAKDNFDPSTSDIDFLVEFNPMTPSAHADNYFGLLENLEDLFNSQIDLVEIATIKNPYFREAVEESVVNIYNAA